MVLGRYSLKNYNGPRSILQLSGDDSTSALSLKKKRKDKRVWQQLVGLLYDRECGGPSALLECSVCCGATGNSFIQGFGESCLYVS